MAVLNGKLYFSWVQRSRLRIPDPTSISADGNWQLAKPTNSNPALIRDHWRLSGVRVFSVSQCLRGENGGCR